MIRSGVKNAQRPVDFCTCDGRRFKTDPGHPRPAVRATASTVSSHSWNAVMSGGCTSVSGHPIATGLRQARTTAGAPTDRPCATRRWH